MVQSQGPTLLGRNWLQSTQLGWKSIKGAYCMSLVEKLIKKHSHLFCSKLRTIQEVKAKIFVPPEAQPCFFKPRLLPYALKSRVKAKLKQLVQAEVITPTQFWNWSAPIIPVIKVDGNIHVCGDYKITVNPVQSQKFTHYTEWMIFSLPYQEVCCSPNLISHILMSNWN